jgi:uncharacterized protein
MDNISFADNPEAHRFELHMDGKLAGHADYNLLKGAIMFTHTEVMPEYEGQGVGSKLAKSALDEVRKRGLHAIPMCQFIARYISRHAEYRDLVTEEHQRAFMKA